MVPAEWFPDALQTAFQDSNSDGAEMVPGKAWVDENGDESGLRVEILLIGHFVATLNRIPLNDLLTRISGRFSLKRSRLRVSE